MPALLLRTTSATICTSSPEQGGRSGALVTLLVSVKAVDTTAFSEELEDSSAENLAKPENPLVA